MGGWAWFGVSITSYFFLIAVYHVVESFMKIHEDKYWKEQSRNEDEISRLKFKLAKAHKSLNLAKTYLRKHKITLGV